MKKNRKTSFIIIRVTQEEKDKIVRDADKVGISITNKIRNMLGLR